MEGVGKTGHLEEVTGVGTNDGYTNSYLPVPWKERDNQATLFNTRLAMVLVRVGDITDPIDSTENIPVCSTTVNRGSHFGIFKLHFQFIHLVFNVIALDLAINLQ